MIKLKRISIVLILLLGSINVAYAVDSSDDADLTVTPVVRQFSVTALGSESAPAIFTIKNNHASATRSLGEIMLSGVNTDEFIVGVHSCSFKTLQPGESCNVPVIFRPLRRGTKVAELQIPSDDAETPVLTAFLTNNVSSIVEAQERMPPTLSSCNIPETMQAGQAYTLSWILEGYHDNYTSYAVLFDCTEESDCGASYGDDSKFAMSPVAYATSISSGNWSYHDSLTQSFNYEWNFTIPASREDGSPWSGTGTDIVVRIYIKSNIDVERNNGSTSLLIPGNQSERYYDTSGRRVLKTIVP